MVLLPFSLDILGHLRSEKRKADSPAEGSEKRQASESTAEVAMKKRRRSFISSLSGFSSGFLA
jgi:hypothetical protein